MKTIQLLKGALMIIAASFLFIACSKDDNGGIPSVPKDSEIIYETDFKKDDGMWLVGENCRFTGGHYEMHGDYYTWTSCISNLFKTGDVNPTLEAVIKLIGNSEDNWGGGGIVFNYQSTSNSHSFLAFEISNDGYVGIFGYKSSTKEWTDIIDWSLNSNVRKNDYNTLRIVQGTDKIRFSVNGKEVATLPAVAGVDLKNSGLFVDSYSDLIATHFRVSKKMQ